MSKPISTARNVHDKFGGSNVHPPSGDVANQGQVTRKSNVMSAGAARPCPPAAVDATGHTQKVTSSPPDTIWVSVDDDGNFSYHPGPDVSANGTVWLVSTGTGSFHVCTYQGETPTDVFDTGPRPYPAARRHGTRYTLKSSVIGNITLRSTTSGSHPSSLGHRRDHQILDGKNGGINVGGGTPPPPPPPPLLAH
ncbi:MAG TPA: hypothetical protein VF516_45945 [Kofleriaceae bacterium]